MTATASLSRWYDSSLADPSPAVAHQWAALLVGWFTGEMPDDVDEWMDAELQGAPRTLTDDLFHYTNADAAIFGILSTGTLRLSPFDSTNDLWESRPSHPNLTMHFDDQDLNPGFELWDEIDGHIRRNSKVACLTMDWDLPDTVMDRDALRGWSHLSLWAHYGAGHSGVCLRFDRSKLLESFESSKPAGARNFHGPVVYRSVSGGAGPYGIDVGQVREFGVDAVATAHADANADAIFFRKHQDWSHEVEYRLVRMDQSVLPFHFDIRPALTGVFLGDAFPAPRLPALRTVLRDYPNAEVFQIRFHNRRMDCWPTTEAEDAEDESQTGTSWGTTRREGSLADRLAALREAEQQASDLRSRAELMVEPVIESMALGIAALAREVSSWPETDVQVHQRIEAVPEAQRSRRPGVAGERVHFERGFMVVVDAVPTNVHVMLASIALQVLDGGLVRLHGAVTTENMPDAPNHRVERWRWMREEDARSTGLLVSDVLEGLQDALFGAREAFDKDRGYLT